MLEVTEAVAGAISAERVGLRLSPYNSFLSAQDTVERANEKNVWLMKQLDSRVPELAYVHMVSPALTLCYYASRLSTVHRYSSRRLNQPKQLMPMSVRMHCATVWKAIPDPQQPE
jgi:2,4-dienoyl-CoA reductase-like NADH-dependent reductase (Old Yellow Enzyme family)